MKKSNNNHLTKNLRAVPVNKLSPKECRYLLVHQAHIDPTRRRAYLLKATRGNAKGWFVPQERRAIKQAIRLGV